MSNLDPSIPILPGAFFKTYPGVFSSMHALNHTLKKRHQNGLMDYQAVIESYGHNSTGARPRLHIVPGQLFEWMRNGQRPPSPAQRQLMEDSQQVAS